MSHTMIISFFIMAISAGMTLICAEYARLGNELKDWQTGCALGFMIMMIGAAFVFVDSLN